MQAQRVSNGKVLTFNDRRDLLGEGGEGKVYNVANAPHLVAKIYHKPKKPEDAQKLAERAEKIPVMVRNPPADNGTAGHRSVAWPVDILVRPNGTREFVGFLMYKLSKAETFYEVANPSRRKKTKFHTYTLEHLYGVACNLVSAFESLHDAGYVVGDVNEGNVLVTEQGLVTVIDTDSFQVPGPRGRIFRCPVGKPEFTGPELQGKTFADVDRITQHDIFGLGVLLFQLLMEGWHPFSGSPSNVAENWSLGKRIECGNFPHGRLNDPIAEPPAAPRKLDQLHPGVKKLFLRCFDRTRAQIRNKQAGKRPDAHEWFDALHAGLSNLRTCSVDNQHVYGRHLRSCPECSRTRARRTAKRHSPPQRQTTPAYAQSQAEVYPGTWRLRPLQEIEAQFASVMSAQQVYHLNGGGQMQMQARVDIPLAGMSMPMVGAGSWSYDPQQKYLILEGIVHANVQSADPIMAMYMQQMPPQHIQASLVLESGSAGRYYVWDTQQGARFILEHV